jgi:hypothetical protein
MPQERLDLLKLPKPIRGPIDKLVRSLDAASTREDLESEAASQISFILELEKTRRLKAADIETLYIIFDDAVQSRLENLPPSK